MERMPITETKNLVDMIVKTNCVIETTSIITNTEKYIYRTRREVYTDWYYISYDIIIPVYTSSDDYENPLNINALTMLRHIGSTASSIRRFAYAHLNNDTRILNCFDDEKRNKVKNDMSNLNEIYNSQYIKINGHNKYKVPDKNSYYNEIKDWIKIWTINVS